MSGRGWCGLRPPPAVAARERNLLPSGGHSGVPRFQAQPPVPAGRVDPTGTVPAPPPLRGVVRERLADVCEGGCEGSGDGLPGASGELSAPSESLTARARRADLWGLELVKALKLLQSNWAGKELPFPDASRTLARSFTLKLLVDSYHKSLGGDRSGALFYSRLARSIAPSATLRAFAFWCEKVTRLCTSGPLSALGRPALGSLRPLEDHFRSRW